MIEAVLTAWAAVAMIQDQGGGISEFGTSGAWRIVKRSDGCFMYADAAEGETLPNIYFNVLVPDRRVNILFINSNWSVPEGPDDGFRLEFGPSEQAWDDLNGVTFMGEGDVGIIGMAFDATAAGSILADLSRADSVELSQRDRVIDRVELRGTGEALGRLLACARSFPEANIAPYPFEAGAGPAASD